MTVTDTITPAASTNAAVVIPPLTTISVTDRRFGGITPMSSNNKPPLKFPYSSNNNSNNNNNAGNNNSSRPSVSTPRVAASQRPTSSNSLHPNVTTRSPRSARKGRAETICSPESQLHTPTSGLDVARPSSAAGSRTPGKPEGYHHQPSPTARPSLQRQNSATKSAAPKFFRADQVRPPKLKPPAPPPLSSSKFFFADGNPTASPRALSPTPTPPSFSARKPGHSSPAGLAIDLGPGSNSYASPLASRPSSILGGSRSRPSSAVSQSVTSTPHSAVLETRNHVKFVYANGTEEILPPRRMGSEVGSAVTSSQVIPNQAIPNQAISSPFSTSPETAPSPVNSSNPVANPQSPVFKSPHSSPRSSMDGTTRHGRALSIGSTVDIINLLKGEFGPDEKDGNENPQAAVKAKIKAMEEAAANARRERKVLDLEISNTSLMAINKTLERQMRKQTAEIRRYRRLARSGRLQSIPGKKFSNHLYEDEVLDSDTASAPEWEASGAEEEEEEEEEEDGEGEDKESSPSEENDGEDEEGETSEANVKKNNSHDGERLDLDLSKHRALLEASAKMNASLKRCQYISEQLISEGKKALEYKVQPSDVQLGGRVLSGDHDEEDEEGEGGGEDEESEESEEDDGEGEDDGDSGSEVTDDGSEEEDDDGDDESDEGSIEESDDDDQDEESPGGEEDRAEPPRLAGYTAAQAERQQTGVRGSA